VLVPNNYMFCDVTNHARDPFTAARRRWWRIAGAADRVLPVSTPRHPRATTCTRRVCVHNNIIRTLCVYNYNNIHTISYITARTRQPITHHPLQRHDTKFHRSFRPWRGRYGTRVVKYYNIYLRNIFGKEEQSRQNPSPLAISWPRIGSSSKRRYDNNNNNNNNVSAEGGRRYKPSSPSGTLWAALVYKTETPAVARTSRRLLHLVFANVVIKHYCTTSKIFVCIQSVHTMY